MDKEYLIGRIEKTEVLEGRTLTLSEIVNMFWPLVEAARLERGLHLVGMTNGGEPTPKSCECLLCEALKQLEE